MYEANDTVAHSIPLSTDGVYRYGSADRCHPPHALYRGVGNSTLVAVVNDGVCTCPILGVFGILIEQQEN